MIKTIFFIIIVCLWEGCCCGATGGEQNQNRGPAGLDLERWEGERGRGQHTEGADGDRKWQPAHGNNC